MGRTSMWQSWKRSLEKLAGAEGFGKWALAWRKYSVWTRQEGLSRGGYGDRWRSRWRSRSARGSLAVFRRERSGAESGLNPKEFICGYCRHTCDAHDEMCPFHEPRIPNFRQELWTYHPEKPVEPITRFPEDAEP